MSKKFWPLALIATGLLAALVSLLADAIGPLQLPVVGLTIGEDPGIGPQQMAGTIIGLLLLLIGIGFWRDWLKMSRGLAAMFALGLLVVVFVALRADEGRGRLSEEDAAAIRAQASSLEGFIRASDWNGLTALFADDAVVMPPNQPPVVGRAAILEWASAYDTPSFNLSPDIFGGRDHLAYYRGIYEVWFGSPMLPRPRPVVVAGSFVLVLEKQRDGSWLFVEGIWTSEKLVPGEGSVPE
jgi:ketosteroid isomerase-like protein